VQEPKRTASQTAHQRTRDRPQPAHILTPPERIESLGRTYILGNRDGYTREEIRQPTHHEYTLEHVSTLWPRHPVYQFQNDTIRGQATTSAYLKWGNRYIGYTLSGGP